MKSFTNKVAAITGASSGIGRALALELASLKSNLTLCSNSNQTALTETAALAAEFGVKVTTAKVDVANQKKVHAWANKVVEDHGQANLVINNAGVAHIGTISTTDYNDYEWVTRINYWGVVSTSPVNVSFDS